jgi:hypothetical protein
MGTKADPTEFDCYAAAEDDEPMFVLLARDATAPDVVRAWADARYARLAMFDGEARVAEVLADLAQIDEARRCADQMETWRDEHR